MSNLPPYDIPYAKAIYDLPPVIQNKIGEIIVKFAYLEEYHNFIISHILGIDDIQARLTLKEPQVNERIKTIKRLMFLKGHNLDDELQGFENTLNQIRTDRNALAHGIWLKIKKADIPFDFLIEHENEIKSLSIGNDVLILGLTSGERGDKAFVKEAKFHSRTLFPEAVAFGEGACNALIEKIDAAIKKIIEIGDHVEHLLQA